MRIALLLIDRNEETYARALNEVRKQKIREIAGQNIFSEAFIIIGKANFTKIFKNAD